MTGAAPPRPTSSSRAPSTGDRALRSDEALDVRAVAADLRRAYRDIGVATRAKGEKAYLKSPLRFHGVTIPQIRAAAAAFSRRHSGLSRRDLRRLAEALFSTDFHDLRSTAIAILERHTALLRSSDLPWLIRLVRREGNWAHVDWLSTKVIGPVVSSTDARARSGVLSRWAKDENLWVRRASLLAQLDELRAGRGDFGLFARLAVPMLEEREFFIRKAIGWVLREVSNRRPRLAFDFLRRHRERVSGLTLREGSRRLPPGLRGLLSET